MDIDLLSRMVKELILDRDRVTLPGVGSFVAEMTPASFSDRGYTINPPYRRLFFRPQEGEDRALISLYASANNVGEDAAESILTDFLLEMREVLKSKKVIVFPGLGRLRATKENNFFFVADENLDIYPEGFCLESISLKTHQETKEELSAAVEELKTMLVVDAVSKESVSGREESDEVDDAACGTAEVGEENDCDDKMESSEMSESSESSEITAAEGSVVASEEEAVEGVEVVELPEEAEVTTEKAVDEEDMAEGVEVVAEGTAEGTDSQEDITALEEEMSEGATTEVVELPEEAEVTTEKTVDGEDMAEGVEVVAEETAEEVAEGTDSQKEVTALEEETSEGATTEVVEVVEQGPARKIMIWIASAVAVIVLFLLVYVLLTRLEPGLLDKLLYDSEQLEVLRYWK